MKKKKVAQRQIAKHVRLRNMGKSLSPCEFHVFRCLYCQMSKFRGGEGTKYQGAVEVPVLFQGLSLSSSHSAQDVPVLTSSPCASDFSCLAQELDAASAG